jgi:hypothetical protein
MPAPPTTCRRVVTADLSVAPRTPGRHTSMENALAIGLGVTTAIPTVLPDRAAA